MVKKGPRAPAANRTQVAAAQTKDETNKGNSIFAMAIFN